MTQHSSEPDSDTGRDAKTGQFLLGSKGGPGRKVGSRNKMATEYFDDAYAAWQKHGPRAFDLFAQRDPGGFCKHVGSLFPKEVQVSALTVNANVEFENAAEARLFLTAYRMARDGDQVIEAKPVDDEGAIVTQGWRADD